MRVHSSSKSQSDIKNVESIVKQMTEMVHLWYSLNMQLNCFTCVSQASQILQLTHFISSSVNSFSIKECCKAIISHVIPTAPTTNGKVLPLSSHNVVLLPLRQIFKRCKAVRF